ncbi:MAG: archaellin/type IV pilin N-terminal domain-containing protein [Candidatus Nitrosotenuis sp.]
MNTNINNSRLRSRKGVAPIIATLLLVAIAVVGGAIIFAYSQNFFSSSQVSGKPTIEAVKIPGYDARPVTALNNQNGILFGASSGGDGDVNMEQGENIAVYIKNDSVQAITISEARLGGIVYNYTRPATLDALTAGQYTVAGVPGGSGGADLLSAGQVAEVQPGQSVSLVLSLSEPMRAGRDAQFKMTTNNGAVFVGTVVIGQQSG